MTTRPYLRLLLASFAALGFYCVPLPAQKPVALPELTYKRLLNDLKVIVATSPTMGESMTIGLVLRYGSAFDPADKGGLANILTRMLAKATADRSAQDIQNELSYLGASLEIRCDWDGTYFFLHTPSQRFERSLLLLYQVVGEAQFSEDELAKAKAEVLRDIDKVEDSRQRLRTQLELTLFRGTTYGRHLRGSRASVQNITLGDVRLFYRRFFSSGSASLIISGSAPVPLLLQKTTRIWGVWVKKDEVPFTFLPPREPAARNIFFRDDPSTPAAQFILGGTWPPRDDPSYYPCVLGARILQERLTKALPTSLLTVGADGRRLPGLFYIQGQAAADQAVSEIRKVLEVVETLKTSALTPEEVADAQNHWIEEFNTGQTTDDGICRTIMESELYRLGTNYAASFPETVRRCGDETIREAAKEWMLPGGVVILVHGPSATLKSDLETLGQLQPLNP